MDIINDKDRLKRLDNLIRLKMTGSPKDLAEKMNTTKRTIFRTICNLKDLDCPIKFSRIENSYVYEYPGELIIGFKKLSDEELNKINGGKGNSFLHSDIFFTP